MPQIIKQHPTDPNKFQIERQVNIWTDIEKTKPNLSDIHNYTHSPIAVLGGGPSLPDDIKKLPKACINISVNHHALRIIDCEYLIFLDDPNYVKFRSPDFLKELKTTKAKKISRNSLEYTDYYCINEAKFYDLSDSGIFALWVASYLTTGSIYLCGFGLRHSDEEAHFYDSGLKQISGPSMATRLHRWATCRDGCENPDRIGAVSGVLQTIF